MLRFHFRGFSTTYSNFLISFILTILLFFSNINAYATHIVGGELGLKHIIGNRYDLNMTLYFDVRNGDPGALDQEVTLHVFRKRDDAFIASYTLPLIFRELVDYTNPDCGIAELVTRRIDYSQRFTLDPSLYNDSQGYYVVWERCCRNKIISNIIDPEGAGQTFYMEFPPLVKDGEPFINSSPELFPPLSDYACVNQPFYFDFGGTDADGDSLVYYLSNPINGNSSRNDPAPIEAISAPYPFVNWNAGHSLNQVIQGDPVLNIDNKGMIRVKPSETGLFVFAVTCDEYRDGKLIGKVIRDFQMLVIDCRLSSPPVATPILPDGSGEYNQTDTIEFRVGDPNKCFDIEVRDRDTGPIKGRVVPIEGFEAGFLPISSGYIRGANDVVNLQACFPPCPTDPLKPGVYGMDVVVEDNNCAVPLQDTVRLFVKIIPEENSPPEITASLGEFSEENQEYTVTIPEGKLLDFSIFGDDIEGDTISLSMQGIGFSPSSLGMNFAELKGLPILTDDFSWQIPCDLLEDDEKEREFLLQFVASDEKICGLKKSDTTFVRIIVEGDNELNTIPHIFANLPYDSVNQFFVDTLVAGDSIQFRVTADDADQDTLNLTASGVDFNLEDFGMIFPENLRGLPLLTADFSWKTSCDLLDEPETEKVFDFQFIATDERLCNQASADTLNLRLVLKPRLDPNEPPKVSVPLKLVDNQTNIYIDTIFIRDEIRFDITATDIDLDSLILDGYGVDFELENLGMEFVSTTGFAPLKTEFVWKPTCETLDILNGETQRTFELIFYSRDFNECLFPIEDFITVRLTVVFEPEPNQAPTLSARGIQKNNSEEYFTEIIAEDNLKFTILGEDSDRDSIRVSVFGDGFDLTELGINIRDTAGIAPLELPFEWQTRCELLEGSSESKDFTIFYVVEDFKNCGFTQKDTIQSTIRLKPLPNPNPPILKIDLPFDEVQNAYVWNMVPSETLRFLVSGEDEDEDEIEIYAQGIEFNLADFDMNFPITRGISPISNEFSWQSTCEMYAQKQSFEIQFFIRDYTKCQLDQFDTAKVKINLTDLGRSDSFIPPNVFTPNGDGKNDTFFIPNLPIDNCEDSFKKIEIYNRWGRKVFDSDVRNFEWDGEGFPNGVYFYKIFFEHSKFKGNVTILGSSVN